jgi:uncharacterized protein YbaP (TraB family)
LHEDDNGYAEYTDILLNNCNENWITKMADFAEIYILAGAGHLAGRKA